MAKNKKQKLGNQQQNDYQTEFGSETNVNQSSSNKSAQKNPNQANQNR